MRTPVLTALAAAALLVLSRSGPAQETESTKQPPPKLDNYGDPLPPGAVLRLGTIRLQARGGFAWMPDGKSLATVAMGKVWLWSVEDGRPLKSLPAPNDGRSHRYLLAGSPDGSKLVCMSVYGDVTVFDLNTGTSVSRAREPSRDARQISALATSPDGTTFATSSGESVRIWDTAAAIPLLSIDLKSAGRLAYAPDSQSLAVCAGPAIHLLNLQQPDKAAVIENAHGRSASGVVFTPDGKRLISAGGSAYERKTTPGGKPYVTNQCELRVWDVGERKLLNSLDFPEPMPGYCQMTLAHDGITLVTMHPDKSFVWNVDNGQVVRVMQHIASRYSPSAMHLDADPAGKYLAANMDETHVRLYDLASGKPLLSPEKRHSEYVTRAAWSRDGQLIATGSGDGTVRLWDATSGELKNVLRRSGARGGIQAVAFSRESRRLFAGSQEFDEKEVKSIGAFRMYDIGNGRIIYERKLPDTVTHAAFSYDEQRIAVAAGLGRYSPEASGIPPTIHVCDSSSGEVLVELKGHDGSVKAMAWSSNDKELLAIAEDGTLRRFDVASGKEILKLDLPHERVEMGKSVKTSLDEAIFVDRGKLVLTNGLFTGDIHAWDVATGKRTWTLNTEASMILAIAVSPDERVLACISGSDSEGKYGLTLWELATRRKLLEIDTLGWGSYCLAFSHDGQRVITGAEGGTPLVWDVSAAWDKLDGVNGAANGATNPKGERP